MAESLNDAGVPSPSPNLDQADAITMERDRNSQSIGFPFPLRVSCADLTMGFALIDGAGLCGVGR